ncbi:hypothetical protein [Sphingobium sp.]|uniref:hypothetical protein n=1 Tax=Sphingobium sp. TaxID=1912891 RepID=UPI003BB4D841
MNSIIKYFVSSMVILAPATASAQSVGGLLGKPVVAAGNLIGNVSGVHHQVLAPTVTGVVPTVAPLADGVTHAIGNVGNGVTATGQSIDANGVAVGVPGSAPLVTVGAKQPGTHGSVAAIANGQ